MINSKIQVSETSARASIARAELHAGVTKSDMKSSALSRVADARACFDRADFWGAANAAVDSLAYSVGMLNPVYQTERANYR